MNITSKTEDRKLYFDVIRVVALLSIVMVHVSAYIVINYPDPTKTVFIIGNIFNGLSRAGVPLFVMLSGSLLLNEDKKFDTKCFYRKSLLWMALLLVGWLLFYSVFYGFVLPSLTGRTPSLKAFVDYMLTFKGSDYPHLWYMFMIVGGYLLIPVLRLFVKRENKQYIFWLIVGSAVLQFALTTLNVFLKADACISFTDFFAKFHMEALTGYIGYFLVGWYLSEYDFKKASRIVLYVCATLIVGFSIFVTQHWIATIPAIRGNVYQELSLPPFIFGMTVFVLIKTLCKEKASQSNFVSSLSRESFGIYMIHVLYLELFTQVWLPYDKASIGVFAYIILSYLTVLVLSYITVWVIEKIPYVKKIFYLK